MAVKVCHFTSAHPRYDIRIFIKECKTLAEAGYDVSLVVADGKGDEVKSGIKIFDAGKSSGRLSRMTKSVWNVYKKALSLDADIYHFHDPELIFVAYFLKLKGKKVIYDVHEDLPRQLLGKHYLGKFSATVLSIFSELVEDFFSKRFTAIITVTPVINKRFLKLNPCSEMIRNFPLFSEFENIQSDSKKENEVCYIGSITAERGVLNMIEAMKKIPAKLNLAGVFGTEKLFEETQKIKGWGNVIFHGSISRKEVAAILSRSKTGLVFFLPLPNHINAYPIKIFEYMAAGVPVVASNFPLWKEIVEGNKCGICVDPDNTKAIADAVNSLLYNETLAQQMGANGKKAIKEKYNWEAESRNLLSFYARFK